MLVPPVAVAVVIASVAVVVAPVAGGCGRVCCKTYMTGAAYGTLKVPMETYRVAVRAGYDRSISGIKGEFCSEVGSIRGSFTLRRVRDLIFGV